ncbi:hypothetical protein GCM10007301_38980 [Azorhizobium oxalatiphilum]|uniref:Lipoprotein n=1 Tax=Azorhizobium oxalatiphilum TaxID=980631 RepID=A0A917C737_9HYPH|nr:hypothetical protein [Azorhizobium oxalatiphilum]GGF75298.1 hypothetical protein GCM10007301_38980 [Azorhizobium oxalatiphilum]
MKACLRVGIGLALAPMLMGFCEGVSSDPRQGGLMGGVCGNATGSYKKRTQDREQALDALEQANRKLNSRLTAGQAEADTLNTRITAVRTRLQRTDTELNQLKVRVARREAQRSLRQAELDTIKREIASLTETYDQLSQRVTAQEATVRAIESGVNIAQRAQSEEKAVENINGEVSRLRERLSAVKQKVP